MSLLSPISYLIDNKYYSGSQPSNPRKVVSPQEVPNYAEIDLFCRPRRAQMVTLARLIPSCAQEKREEAKLPPLCRWSAQELVADRT